jgi:hypothetical protein
MCSLLDLLGDISGYKAKYERCSINYANCSRRADDLDAELTKADEEIKRLKALLPRPAPPELTYVVEKDSLWVQGVIEDMNAEIIRLPLGNEFRLTNKDTFLDFIAWSWIDEYEYHKFYRCGNFSIALKADADKWGVNQVGIVLDYNVGHAYNLVIFPNRMVMSLEPQSDHIFYSEPGKATFYNLEGAVVII